MPTPDAGKTTETREQMQLSKQYNVPALDAISPISAPAVLRGEEQWEPFGPLSTDLTMASISGVSNPREKGQWRNDLTPIPEFQNEYEIQYFSSG